jgi:hypothetical protein
MDDDVVPLLTSLLQKCGTRGRFDGSVENEQKMLSVPGEGMWLVVESL